MLFFFLRRWSLSNWPQSFAPVSKEEWIDGKITKYNGWVEVSYIVVYTFDDKILGKPEILIVEYFYVCIVR